jgi:hypothetical protein
MFDSDGNEGDDDGVLELDPMIPQMCGAIKDNRGPLRWARRPAFEGVPDASSALEFGTQGINFRARKPQERAGAGEQRDKRRSWATISWRTKARLRFQRLKLSPDPIIARPHRLAKMSLLRTGHMPQTQT